MKTIEYNYVDKSAWGQGEWSNEPDKVQFEDEATKMPCLIVRGPSGALCGYVGVSEGHPFFGKDYSDCTLPVAKARGKRAGDEFSSFGDKSHKNPDWMVERMRNKLICTESYCSHTPESILEAHGGITFAGFCNEREDNHGICHIPEAGEPDKVWWFGFDCAHSGDICPSYKERFSTFDYDSYKNLRYVKNDISRLAKQLFDIGNTAAPENKTG